MQNLIITLQAQGQGNMMQTITFMGLIFIVFYFFMVRPQQKKLKQQKKYVEELKKGDLVVTTGGIHGKIVSLEATTAIIESESYKLKIERSAISSELSAPLNKVEEAKVETKA